MGSKQFKTLDLNNGALFRFSLSVKVLFQHFYLNRKLTTFIPMSNLSVCPPLILKSNNCISGFYTYIPNSFLLHVCSFSCYS